MFHLPVYFDINNNSFINCLLIFPKVLTMYIRFVYITISSKIKDLIFLKTELMCKMFYFSEYTKNKSVFYNY